MLAVAKCHLADLEVVAKTEATEMILEQLVTIVPKRSKAAYINAIIDIEAWKSLERSGKWWLYMFLFLTYGLKPLKMLYLKEIFQRLGISEILRCYSSSSHGRIWDLKRNVMLGLSILCHNEKKTTPDEWRTVDGFLHQQAEKLATDGKDKTAHLLMEYGALAFFMTGAFTLWEVIL